MTIIVNTDYESVLFHNKPSLKMRRELEFLGLWLNDRIQNVEEYNNAYLQHIARYTGRVPQLVKHDAKAINWWGKLRDIENEQYLNSKKTSLKISQELGESVGIIIDAPSQLNSLSQEKTYLFKSFSGVSGKGHKFLSQLKEIDFPLIAEELHMREVDFSTYCSSNNDCYLYQNLISPQFDYKGSFFELENSKNLLHLDFVKKRPDLSWDKYLANIEKIISIIRERGEHGFSIDSYIYDNKIRSLCDINYRRTMGITALEIAKVISPLRFQLFLIIKNNVNYNDLLNFCESIDSVLLSHDKNLFSYLLISAASKESLKEKIKSLELILSYSLAINVE